MFVCAECGQSMPAQGLCPADGTPLLPIGDDLLLGTMIGAYRVARLLGVGGMGRVYKGVQPAIGSRVAIKVLSRECTDRRDLVERFFAEARAVNLIRHESIVNVLDLAVLPDGRPYIIMEYLDGAPLTALIEHAALIQAPLPLGGIARLAAEVLDALGAAHVKGIVHRDLKPDNVFVAPSGRPKVLDFGIAKLSEGPGMGPGLGSTRTGSLLGTPHYMSSEQAAGRPVDHRADLYAMGVMLFECTTGRKPFLAEALFDLLRMHVEAPPPSPRALRPDMPVELEQVILTALAKAPDQRFATAMAMSQALQHATAQLPPDQWRTLTPPAARAAGSGWAPTPPSAWANPSTQPWSPSATQPAALQSTLPASPPAPGTGAQDLSRTATMPPSPATPPSSRPLSTQPATQPAMQPSTQPATQPAIPSIDHAATVSDGQVTQRPRPARRARWIGLAALVVGGATAANSVFSHSEDRRRGEERTTGDSGDRATASGDAWGTGAKVTPPVPEHPASHEHRDRHRAKAKAKASADAEDSDDKDDAEDRDDSESDALAEAYRQVDEALRSLPPAQRKQLAGYRNLGKLPPEQRLEKLQQLIQLGIPGLEVPDAAAIARAAAGADPTSGRSGATGRSGVTGRSDDVVPAPPAPPPPPRPPGSSAPAVPTVPNPSGVPTPPAIPAAPTAPSAWISNETIDPPAGYDPEHLDVTAFVAWANQRARKAIPDAQMIRLDANGVGPDGRANLKLATLASEHGSIDVRFISPSRGKRDPSQPLGIARHDFKCEFRVMATPDGVELMPIDFADCSKERVVPVPRCSLTGVWKRATARKAPRNAVGNIGYRANGARPVWYFDIGAGFDVAFSQTFSDDC